MKNVLFALSMAVLAGCAAPHAYSGSTETTGTQGSSSSESGGAGAGGAEPTPASSSNTKNVFSPDDVENQRRAHEAWEAAGG